VRDLCLPQLVPSQELGIVQNSPARSQQSYRHEAFVWHDVYDFVAGMVPFIKDGLETGEPVMVAVIPEHTQWLRDSLAGYADDVEFVDMSRLGHNPARIIPAWQQFLDHNSGLHRPARGIGEPIWPGRRPEELLECQLHEALLNVAVDPEIPFWLICPYDAQRLSACVLEEAHRSHPVIVESDAYQGSACYGGRAHVDSMFAAPLSALAGEPRLTTFTSGDVSRLVTYLKLELYVAGLAIDKAADLATATHRLALGSLHRGATEGTVRIWCQPHSVVCEVTDDTEVSDPLLGRRVPFAEDHNALWLANQICDLVQLRSTPTGTTVRVHTWI
jgi:hypothetical protein